MVAMLENYGLKKYRDLDSIKLIMSQAISEGKVIPNYYGGYYIKANFKDVEFYLMIDKNEYDEFELVGFHCHNNNNCIWKMAHSGINLKNDDLKYERAAMFNRYDDHGGLLPIHIINVDVLPSFMEKDVLDVQVVAMPMVINYFADENEYSSFLKENDISLGIALGALFPLNFLNNHNAKSMKQETEYDDVVHFAAKVKEISTGCFGDSIYDEQMFIRCVADTNYGELEFVHSIDQVPEKMRENIKVGSIISGICVLSGNVAINEYENGMVKDFNNYLKLLNYTLIKGQAERLASVLSVDAVYESQTTNKKFIGPKEIINRFCYIHGNRTNEHITQYATITAVDNELEYPVNTRCIYMFDDEDRYMSLAFITVDETGNISKILIHDGEGYHFEFGENNEDKSEDLDIPDSVFVPMILKGKRDGYIDKNVMVEEVIEGIVDYAELLSPVNDIWDSLIHYKEMNMKEVLSNILGYLFVKGIEKEIHGNNINFDTSMAITGNCSYIELFDELNVEELFDYGKQFYDVYEIYLLLVKAKGSQIMHIFKDAATIVQVLGQLYYRGIKEKNLCH